jgi:hypothetical protein
MFVTTRSKKNAPIPLRPHGTVVSDLMDSLIVSETLQGPASRDGKSKPSIHREGVIPRRVFF